MPQSLPVASAVAPLLIELARSLRARQYLGAGHATLDQALAKTAAVWNAVLRPLGPVEFEVGEQGFSVAGSERVRAPALETLAASFEQHRVVGLSVHPDVTARELELLVLGLAESPAANGGGLAARLKSGGVRHLALWTLPEPVAAPRAREARPAPAPAAAAPVPAPAPAPLPEGDGTVGLLRALAELEPCDEPAQYKEIADQVGRLVDELIAAGNAFDAYRAALVYGRHTNDQEGRSPDLRDEALARLRALFRAPALRDFMLERASSAQSSTSVQAIQLLAAVVPDSAAWLIDQYGRGNAERRRHVARILVVIGPPALPLLARELDADSPGRVRRATRLLGDMQNPDATELLAARVASADASLQREVVRSLACIGTPRAIQVLAETLRSGGEAALFAASGLGTVHRPEAVRALVAVAQDRKGRSFDLRREAVRNLGRLGDAAALPALVGVLEDRGWLSGRRSRELRVAAAEAIGKVGGDAARAALEPHASGGDPDVRQACIEILAQLEAASAEQPLP